MSAKIEGLARRNLTITKQDEAIALTLDRTLSGGIRQSLSVTQLLINAAAIGDKSAAKWLAKAGIETATASNGTTIVLRRDGSIGAWIV